MSIQKVQQGSSTVWLSGQTYNKIADSVNRLDAGTPRASRTHPVPRVVYVQNETSQDIPMFAPVVIGEPSSLAAYAATDSSYANSMCFRGLETNAGTQVDGIALKNIPYDAYGSGAKGTGQVLISGFTNAIINVTDVLHRYAKTTSTPFELESCHDRTSVHILHSEVGTAKVCKVNLLPKVQTLCVGKTTQQISAGNNGTVEIYRAGSATGEIVTAQLDWMTSDSISDGKEVLIDYFYDEFLWRIIGAECEDSVSSSAFQIQNDSQAQTLTTSYSLIPGMTVIFQSGDGIVSGVTSLSYAQNWAVLDTSTVVSAAPTVSGMNGAITYSISAGALPAGLSIASATGIVSGLPTTVGSGTFVVRGIDSLSQEVVTPTQSWTVGAPVTITLTYPYNWSAISPMMPINWAANISGATAPLTYSVETGALPAGITLNTTTGAVSGTAQGSPPAVGSGSVSIKVTDTNSDTATSPVYNWNVI